MFADEFAIMFQLKFGSSQEGDLKILRQYVSLINDEIARVEERIKIEQEEWSLRSKARKVKKTKEQLIKEIEEDIKDFKIDIQNIELDIKEQNEKMEILKNGYVEGGDDADEDADGYIVCPCGSKYKPQQTVRHLKTVKHTKYLEKEKADGLLNELKETE